MIPRDTPIAADTDAWIEADPIGCDICGREACEDHLPPDPTETTAPALRARPARALLTDPAPVDVIAGVATADCVTVIVAESGGGKTFIALDAAAAVSDNVAWHGRPVVAGSSVYVPFEGDAYALRLRALTEHAGRTLDHLYVMRATAPISRRVTREGEEAAGGERDVAVALLALAADLATHHGPPIRLVVVDTVRASLSGSEDSSEHVSAYLRAVRRLMTLTPGAAWVLVHHAGWQDGDTQRKRERGSSAWRGNCDTTLYLDAGEYDPDRGEAALTLKALKVRDGERPAPLALLRRRVTLSLADRNGVPLTSCIVVADPRSRADREASAVAAVRADERALDLRTLRVIVDRPDVATSQDRIRLLLNVRKSAVGDSLTRLVRLDWAHPGPRNLPFIVTHAGRAALTEQTS